MEKDTYLAGFTWNGYLKNGHDSDRKRAERERVLLLLGNVGRLARAFLVPVLWLLLAWCVGGRLNGHQWLEQLRMHDRIGSLARSTGHQ